MAAFVCRYGRCRHAVAAVDALTEVHGTGLRVVVVGQVSACRGDRDVRNAVVAQHLFGDLGAGQAAREMLHAHNSGVQVTEVSGSLTDHFDPTRRLVGLSNAVYGSSSISALAVAAHEIGHVLQYEEGYSLMTLRSKILPAAQLGSNAGPIIAIVGLMIQSNFIASLGLYLYAAMFLFQLITLPVEINASKRGLDLLQEGSYIPREKEYAAKAVLRAAAMTYVWAAIGSLLSLLRLAILVKGNRRRD